MKNEESEDEEDKVDVDAVNEGLHEIDDSSNEK